MTLDLDGAIQHCKDKAKELRAEAEAWSDYELVSEKARNSMSDCRECASEHEQLAKWLTELKHLREVRALLKQRIVNTDFDMGDYYDHTQEIINKVFDVIDKVYDEVLYDAKENNK